MCFLLQTFLEISNDSSCVHGKQARRVKKYLRNIWAGFTSLYICTLFTSWTFLQ